MLYTDKTCREFVEHTAGKTPVPGGGSVSALVGALGAALGRMVGSLTLGKKKYADVQDEMLELVREADRLQAELLDLVQADIDIFRPLAELYGMKAETDIEKEKKAAMLEEALENACGVPISIMEKCGRAIELSKEFAAKGSRLAVSDAGASAIICKSALQAASLNVYINTGSMTNRKRADELNTICAMHLMNYATMADEVFEMVADKLRG